MPSGGKRPGSGRKKGKPNELTATVKKSLVDAFHKLGGVEALVEWAKGEQTEFYKLWAKIMPQELRAEITGKDGKDFSVKAEFNVTAADLAESGRLAHEAVGLLQKNGNEQPVHSMHSSSAATSIPSVNGHS